MTLRNTKTAFAVAHAMSALLIGCGLMLSSCGGDETPKERSLTDDEVQLLSNVLYRNHTAGGIEFTLSSKRDAGGGTLTIQGAWSFTDQGGCARVDGGTPPNPVTEVCWAGNAVAERRPSLDDDLAALGFGTATFIARPADFQRRRLDVLLKTVTSLGTEQPENAVLIRQKPDTAFIRTDTLRGIDVVVLRYGDRLLWWIDPTTGDLLRFEGRDSGGTTPVIIDVTAIGPMTIRGPADTAVVTVDRLGDNYLAWAPSSP